MDILGFLVVRVPPLLPVAHHDPDAKNITQVDIFMSRWTVSFSHWLQTHPSPSLLNVALKNIWYERQGPDLLLTIGPISPGGPGAPVFPRSPWRTTRHHQKGPPKKVIFNPSSHFNSCGCANHTFPRCKHIGNNNTRMFNLGGRYFVCVRSHTLHWRTATNNVEENAQQTLIWAKCDKLRRGKPFLQRCPSVR